MENSADGREFEEMINYNYVKKAAMILRALDNPLRQKIFTYLAENYNTTVTEIILNFQVEQSVISQHLAVLRRAKIISNLKNGKFVHYYINKKRVTEIQNFVNSISTDTGLSN